MSVTLVGGAFDPATAPGLLGPFLAEARSHASERPVVAVLLLDEGRLGEFLPSYVAGLGPDVDVLPVPLSPDEEVPAGLRAELARADGVLVGGGWTPGYHRALFAGTSGVQQSVWQRVWGGTPYAGFSAGAMVAGDTALLGGYLSGGREVCEECCSEGLDEDTCLTLAPGERPEDGQLRGAGSAWLIRAGAGGEAVVRRVAAR